MALVLLSSQRAKSTSRIGDQGFVTIGNKCLKQVMKQIFLIWGNNDLEEMDKFGFPQGMSTILMMTAFDVTC